MSLIKNFILITFIIILTSLANAEEIKKIGKFKDWEAMIITKESGKVCFAQSIPVLQAPKKNPRDARLFVSFRP